MAVHNLTHLTWRAFAELPRARTVAILPIGAIEAHGPHLPLGTDIVIATAMAAAGARRLSDRGLDVLLLPPLTMTAAPFAAGFGGTIDVPGETTTAVVQAVARSLHRHGVTTLALANAHHDPANVAALRAASDGAGSDSARIVFPDLTRRRWAERLTDEFRSGACHAGRYEGSIVLAAAPASVDTATMRRLTPNPRSLVEAIREGQRTFEDAGGPDAYFGAPAEATADEGQRTIELLAMVLEEAVMQDLQPQETS